jgi:hypothetical protein
VASKTYLNNPVVESATATTVPVLNADKEITSSAVTPTELGYVSGVTSAIQTQIDAKASTASLTAHESDTTSIHGITDTAALVTLTGSQTLTNKTLTAPVISTISNSGTLTLPTSTDTIVGRATTDTLTNKTMTAPAINGANQNFGTASNTNRLLLPSDTTTNLDTLTDTAGLLAYDTTQSKPVYNTGSGWTAVGSGGGGSGGINYISNPDAETSTTGWSTYADAASATVTDGTGGSPNVTITRTTSISEVIREKSTASGSFKFSKDAANRQGEGVSFDFQMDRVDCVQSRAIVVSFDYQTTANYASGDIRVFAVTDTGGTPQVLNVLNGDSGNVLPADSTFARTGRFVGAFNTDAVVASNNYRLVFHITSTNASAYDFVFDNVKVTPEQTVPGAIVTPWESWTPTGTFVANTTYSGFKRRNGDMGEYIVSVATSGAPTSTTLTVNQPSGEVIDTAKLPSSTAGLSPLDGFGYVIDSGARNIPIAVVYSSTTAVQPVANAGGAGSAITQASPITFGASDFVRFSWRVPIVGWTASAALSTTETMLMGASVRATGDPASASAGNPIIVPTESWDTLNSYSTSTGLFTAPRTSKYMITVAGQSANTAAGLFAYINSSQDIRLCTSDSNGEFSGGGEVSANAGDTISVRPGGTFDASEFVLCIQEVVNPTVFSVYGATDYQETTNTSATNWAGGASGAWADFTSLSLSPGEWDITGVVCTNNNGAVTAASAQVGISSTSGNSATGLNYGTNRVVQSIAATSGLIYTFAIPRYRVVVTITTTFYLKGSYGAVTTNLQTLGYAITARKVK